jgi:hypothetical protein
LLTTAEALAARAGLWSALCSALCSAPGTAAEFATTALRTAAAAFAAAAAMLLTAAATAFAASAVVVILGRGRSAHQAKRQGGRDHVFHSSTPIGLPSAQLPPACAGQGELVLNGSCRIKLHSTG